MKVISDRAGLKANALVQQPHFNTISLDSIVPDEELLQMVDHAYDMVVTKLSKYVWAELSRAE
ncbi:MAG: hypothetical protein QM689_12450 [Oscillospiraceae bacterium]